MLTTGMDNRARPGMPCSECNDLLVAPKSSAYVSNREIRHVWSCESCGHEIEMAVNLRFAGRRFLLSGPRSWPESPAALALVARLRRLPNRRSCLLCYLG